MAGFLGHSRDAILNQKVRPTFYDQILKLPHLLAEILEPLVLDARAVAAKIAHHKGFFFIGRGYSYPIALEGALKLKEIAYVHAEGYAGGELKHGPIAMIDNDMVVVVLAPRDSWREKTLSNLEEVRARGAVVLGIGDAQDATLRQACEYFIPLSLPSLSLLDEALLPFFLTPAIQMLSYELALLHGTDVDKPRNLAKSVTVE